MRMHAAQKADTAVSANRLVNVLGPTGLKALRGTQEEAEYTNKPV